MRLDQVDLAPDSPKHAKKVEEAANDHVWVAAEPIGGLKLGQEPQGLNRCAGWQQDSLGLESRQRW